MVFNDISFEFSDESRIDEESLVGDEKECVSINDINSCHSFEIGVGRKWPEEERNYEKYYRQDIYKESYGFGNTL